MSQARKPSVEVSTSSDAEAEFRKLYKSFKKSGNIAEWLENNYLDYKLVITSGKDIEEIRLLGAFGGPTVWHILDDNCFRIERYEFGSQLMTSEYCSREVGEIFDKLAEERL